MCTFLRTIATRVAAMLLLIVAVAPAAAQDQSLPPPSRSLALFRPAPIPPPARPASFIHGSAPDYRWEGLVIGATVLGVVGATFVIGFCSDPDSNPSGHGCLLPAIEGFLFGATVGGV